MKYFSSSFIVKYFLLCSLLTLMTGCSSSAPVVQRTATAKQSDFVVWTTDLRSDYQKNSYSIVLKTSDKSISGLCILKKNGEEWRGTLINEIGAKAFDFIVTDKKCELLNVISMMDKWYIKKTVAADLHFLFSADNPKAPFQNRLERFEQDGIKVVNYQKKQISVKPDNTVLLINRRHNLQYELRKICETDSDKVVM